MSTNAINVAPSEMTRHAAEDPNAPVQVTLSVAPRHLQKLMELMDSGAWERAQEARAANQTGWAMSASRVLYCARNHHGTSGGRVCATLLASLYNGQRVRFDVSDLLLLDRELFEHAMNTMRLCYETNSEPHTFFEGGGAIFEEMIETWGLEKKRRARR